MLVRYNIIGIVQLLKLCHTSLAAFAQKGGVFFFNKIALLMCAIVKLASHTHQRQK